MRRKTWMVSAWLLALLIAVPAAGQRQLKYTGVHSGGVLTPEMAAYDVKFYDLDVRIEPADSSIAGTLLMRAQIVQPAKEIVLELDPVFEIRSIRAGADEADPPLAYRRQGWEIRIAFPMTRQPGDSIAVRVTYAGRPKVAKYPPWVGGFVWKQTPAGAPWVTVTCQMDGAHLWWPTKDHPSDEPDSMALHFTVPDSLFCAANGRLRRITKNDDGTRTFHWFVANPINNYSVIPYLAPYRAIKGRVKSIAGDEFPIELFILPEHEKQGRWLFEEMQRQLRFFEETLGPYPFRSDKFGVAEAPHLGMEHQTIIAYGSQFKPNDYGFDWLLLHEFAHEWWGNLVTAADWKDFWIHEGFATYMEALCAEALQGEAAYHRYVQGWRRRVANVQPLAPRQTRTTVEMYRQPPDYRRSNSDIYFKGALVLHTLRYLIGNDALRQALRKMAYPTPELAAATDGSQCRFVTTDDFLTITEQVSGQDLDWFFEVYMRQPALPRLLSEMQDGELKLRWQVPDDLPFPMPVDIRDGGKLRRIAMPAGQATVSLKSDAAPEIDPQRWILQTEVKN